MAITKQTARTMPGEKKRTKQLQSTQSDYDTDSAAPAPVTMAPPTRTNTELNLLVLRRYVPDMERIMSIAPFAVVYLFSPETQQWEKSGVEGTLFVCQLSGAEHPRYNVVILNRKSLDNFITELVSGDDIEITEQYVILQVMGEDSTPDIYGVWIFSEEGTVPSVREVVANSIQECAVRAEMARENTAEDDYEEYTQPEPYNLDGAVEATPDDNTFVQQVPNQQVDLLSLFNKPAGPANQTPHNQPSVSDAKATQQQNQRPSQSNALLDLFKNAKTG